MPVIRTVWTDAAGVPLRNEWVMTTLISRAGWSKDGRSRAVRVHSDMTDNTGLWTSPDLPPQSSYEEAGTYYRVECAGKIEYFDVPDSGGPYWLADRRRSPVPVDADWKVLAKLVELPDALALAGATEGQVPVYNATTKLWQPITRVTAQQLADGLASKAAKQYTDDADQALSNRISPLETWKPTVDTALGGKASTTSVTGLQDRTTVAEQDITSLKARVTTVEGGGSGSSGAVQHSSLRYLVTKADNTPADDHPQYLNATRGDGRYYTKSAADQAFAGITHAARHASGGGDAITPASIGASPSTHTLDAHPGNGSLVPVVRTTVAAATAANPASATIMADTPLSVGTNNTAKRSLRQPLVHDWDWDINDVVLGATNLNTVFQYDFTARETCELLFHFTLFGWLSAAGSVPAATAGSSTLSFYIQERNDDGTLTRLWDGYRQFMVDAYAATNNVRIYRGWSYSARVPGVTVNPGQKLRFLISAQKDAANADLGAYYCRGWIMEVASDQFGKYPA